MDDRGGEGEREGGMGVLNCLYSLSAIPFESIRMDESSLRGEILSTHVKGR